MYNRHGSYLFSILARTRNFYSRGWCRCLTTCTTYPTPQTTRFHGPLSTSNGRQRSSRDPGHYHGRKCENAEVSHKKRPELQQQRAQRLQGHAPFHRIRTMTASFQRRSPLAATARRAWTSRRSGRAASLGSPSPNPPPAVLEATLTPVGGGYSHLGCCWCAYCYCR